MTHGFKMVRHSRRTKRGDKPPLTNCYSHFNLSSTRPICRIRVYRQCDQNLAGAVEDNCRFFFFLREKRRSGDIFSPGAFRHLAVSLLCIHTIHSELGDIARAGFSSCPRTPLASHSSAASWRSCNIFSLCDKPCHRFAFELQVSAPGVARVDATHDSAARDAHIPAGRI